MNETTNPTPSPDALNSLRDDLLDWFSNAKRPLPWRTKRSVYRTVVSEFMLQQTQVKTVLPYFERWITAFPDFAALAAAPEAAVLKHWEGLGYYSRARNLHRLAKAVTENGAPPTDADGWKKLPGVGPYASAAIASIALGEPIAVVDGNVVRVLARLLGDATPFRDNGAAVEQIRPSADRLLNSANPGDHNEAMMELGATVCLRHRPLCTVCPWVDRCNAAATGRTETIPSIQRKATIRKTVVRLWIVSEGNILLHRIPDDSRRLAGQYELPARDSFADAAGIAVDKAALLSPSRGIANERIAEPIHTVQLPGNCPPPPAHHWLPLADLDSYTLVGPHRKWIRQLIDSPAYRR